MTDVLVLGDANPDLILRGDVVPRFGQAEQLLSAADLVIGGSGGIFAHALARLGRSTRLVATIGKDPFGELMERLLAAGGVETTALRSDPGQSTGVTVVLSANEDRASLTYPGAIHDLTAEQAHRAIDDAVLDGARHVHVCSYFLLPALAPALPEVLQRARAAGLTTSLDTNFDPAERWEGVERVLPHVDVLLPNRSETIGLATSVSGDVMVDVEAAAQVLARRGPLVVVKDGRDGAFQVDRDGKVIREWGSPVEPLDTTGAGDTFAAAYLDAQLLGLEAGECLRRACLAGALSTAGVGGTAAQPYADQLASSERAPDAPRHP